MLQFEPNAPYCTKEGPYFGNDIPFMQHIGLIAEHIEEGYARARLPAKREHLNSREVIHGGTMMSVLDFIMSAAARGHDPLSISTATIEMSSHFLEAATGELVFEGHVLRRGRSTAFCEGTAVDARGTRVCVARATFKLLPRK